MNKAGKDHFEDLSYFYFCYFEIRIKIAINTLLCPSKNNFNTIELTVHTSCYLGIRLTL